MNIKKINAAAGLILVLLLLVHVIYEVWSYVALYYNPLVTKVIGWSFAGVTVFHILLSMTSLYRKHDGSTLRMYPRANLSTILQRGSAFCILILLPVHIKTGDWIMQHKVGATGLYLLIAAEILFWLMIGIHVTLSLSRALISLGWLQNMARKKAIDITAGIICAAGLTMSAYIIITTQLFLYNSNF